MKTLNTLLISIFSIITFQAAAQEFIGSNVRLSKEIETGGSYSSSEIGLIKLNDQNDEFVFDIRLFPILTTPKDNDSITTMNKSVVLHFKTQFPVSDLDFLSNDGSEQTFTVPAELTINNITRAVNIRFGLHSAMAQTDEARGIQSFPAMVSFVIEINPAEYNLDFETINFVRTMYVEVRNGTINRTTNTSVTQ
ncbi:MAG: hypothetical protein JWO09_603 [Bacteroidetes bacterium]|nr:hypothetical protein [Bacteroidota bacterium]